MRDRSTEPIWYYHSNVVCNLLYSITPTTQDNRWLAESIGVQTEVCLSCSAVGHELIAQVLEGFLSQRLSEDVCQLVLSPDVLELDRTFLYFLLEESQSCFKVFSAPTTLEIFSQVYASLIVLV